jgi:tether containing UBX domain for GLUT4
MRYAGLSPGARLQLTLLSKSPSVVNVAIQLPDSSGGGQVGQRLTDKFPSTTSIWMVLRKFEAGIAGRSSTTNLTGRGIAKGADGNTGSGRLYYETPVISHQGRSWRSFTDLQKTLAQLGFTKGSVLFRVVFEATETPLEEAMQEIDYYFKAVNMEAVPEVNPAMGAATEHQSQDTAFDLRRSPDPEVEQESTQPIVDDKTLITTEASVKPERETDSEPALASIPGVSSRPITVFSPPSSDTPQAARMRHNPQDFVPTIEHAKVHQALLNKASANRRLPSDSEVAVQHAEKAEKLAAVSRVDIKIRFPDQSSAVATFSKEDTTNDLFEYVKNLLANAAEPFGLQYTGNKGNKPLPKGDYKLIADMGMMNRVLVIVLWEEGASEAARKGKSLKAEVAAQSKEIHIQELPQVVDDEPALKVSKNEDGEDKGKSKVKGVPKWLKLPGKK